MEMLQQPGRVLARWPVPASMRRVVRCSGGLESGNGGKIMREILTNVQRTKINVDDDRKWYDVPRIVQHSDSSFRDKVTHLYRDLIPSNSAVLDLCSSWVSHLPPEVTYSLVVGHGLNAEELLKNPRLDRFFVRNLNVSPDEWAIEDETFDAVLCCCSIQYLQQPERVWAEIHRVLKPGGVCIVTFTDRLFYEKAIAAWREASMYSRAQLVKQYFMGVSGWTEPEVLTEVALPTQRGILAWAEQALQSLRAGGRSDPFRAVIAYKNFCPRKTY